MDPTKNKGTFVCEFHLKPEEIKISAGYGRKSVIDNNPPSIFRLDQISKEKPKRKSPRKRPQPVIESSSESEVLSESEESENDVLAQENQDFEMVELSELEILRRENEELKKTSIIS